VAGIAGKICDALVQNGYRMDRNIITAAGFLHDMAKGKKGHEKKTAILLREMGFPVVASIVADHTDLDCSDRSPINPSEVLYLADKLADGSRRVTIDERFQSAMDKYGHDPNAKRKIRRRMTHARIIMKKVRQSIGETAAQHLFSA
jgi:HD superfamily phosphohydrolase YqeK